MTLAGSLFVAALAMLAAFAFFMWVAKAVSGDDGYQAWLESRRRDDAAQLAALRDELRMLKAAPVTFASDAERERVEKELWKYELAQRIGSVVL